jgi:hypothetical protein
MDPSWDKGPTSLPLLVVLLGGYSRASSAMWTAVAQGNGYGSTQVQTSENRHT